VPKAKKRRALISRNVASSDNDVSGNGSQDFDESDWSAEENKTGAYKEFQKRKTVKRKRQAAETNRIRAVKKSRTNAATSIIGRKPQKKKPTTRADSGDEQDSEKEAFLDEPTPEYIEARKAKLKRLREAGLRLRRYRLLRF